MVNFQKKNILQVLIIIRMKLETQQGFAAENTAKDAKITYFSAKNEKELDLNVFFNNKGAALLEIHTNSIENAAELKRYMSLFKAWFGLNFGPIL